MKKRILITIAIIGSILCVGCSGAKEKKPINDNPSTEYDAGEETSESGSDEEATTSSKDESAGASDESSEGTTTVEGEGATSIQDETTGKTETATTNKTENTTTNKNENATTKPGTTTATKPSGGSSSNEQETTTASNTGSGNTNVNFSMNTTEIQVQEWGYMYVGMYVNNYSDSIKWTTSDSSIAQVVDGYVFGVYPGTTTLTGTLNGKSVTAKVKVTESSYATIDINTDRVTLFEGEMYKLLSTKKDAKFTSANTSVATVASDGTIKGISAGTTTITATSNGKSVQCKVKIVKNDGTYYDSKLSTNYKVATERTMYVTDRIILRVDAGTPLEDGFLDKLEGLLDAIEDYTGLSYTDTSDSITKINTVERVQINVISNASAYGSAAGITVQPYDLAMEQNGIYPLVHELLHTIQMRNSVYVGNLLTEGFAVYFGEQIAEELPYPITWDVAYSEYAWMQAGITASNIEAKLISGDYQYEAGYLLVRYIVNNYGKAKIMELFEDITLEGKKLDDFTPPGVMTALTQQNILDVIKTNTRADLVSKFYTYAAGCGKTVETTVTDLTGMSKYYMTFAGHCEDNYWGIEDHIKCDGSIIIDLTKAIDYAEKVYGRKFRGIYDGYMYDVIQGVTVTYYDANGNEVEGEIIELGNFGKIMYAKGAVMAKYEGVTEFDFQQDIRFEFDSDFAESWGL